MNKRLVGPLLLGMVVLLPLQAGAELAQKPLAGEPPTLGVHLPTPSLVGGWDATGVELNPAAIGMLSSWSLLLHDAELREQSRTGGTGTALLAATPVPMLRSLVLGFGFQWLRPAEPIGYVDYVKLSFAAAWRPSSMFSLGAAFHTFVADGDPELDSLNTLDLGLVLRPFEWLAAGLAVRNLVTPVYAGLPLERVYDLEFVLRPLADRSLELGLGAAFGERRGTADPHLRLEAEPLTGLRLFLGAQLLTRDFYRNLGEATDYRFSVGFGFELERMGLAISTVAGRSFPPGGGPLADQATRASYQGVEATVHVHGTRRPPMAELEKKILLLKLSGDLSERELVALVDIFQRVEERPDVHGVLLELDGLDAGMGRIQELRRWVARLRQADKKVYAFLRQASQREYYLAAACDRVLLDPAGRLEVKGLALRSLYFRGSFDLLGINPEFVRIAEYKSAPEAYTRRGPSAPALKVARSLADDFIRQITRDLGQDRHRSPAEIRKLFDDGPFLPPRARAAGLVDELVEAGELKRTVERALRGSLVSPSSLRRGPERWPVGPGIAVVVVDGDITSGKSLQIPLLGRRLEGDETINRALAWARREPSVKAVVLRVNSPGGSAWASDKMFAELWRLRETKPVVVSMADLAASGGYYIAAAGHRILAEPATVTGSIGIFTGKFDVSGLLGKLGISSQTLVVEGKRALIDSFDRPYTAEERAFVLSNLQYYYRRFLAAVAKGRGMTQDAVHELARGRVWTGAQARKRGLIDAVGGLQEALEDARRLAGVPLDRPLRLWVLPREKPGLLGRLFQLFDQQTAVTPVPRAIQQALGGLMPVLLRMRANEPLTRLPYELSYQ